VRHGLAAVGVLHGEVIGGGVNRLGVHAPALCGVRKRPLPLNEVTEVRIIQRVGLAEVAAGVELVEPHLARGRALLEEEHDGLHARALERAAGAVEHGVEVAAFQQELAQAHGGVVGVGKEGILDDHAAASAGLQDFDEVLEEEEGGLAGADGEVLLDLGAFLAAEGGIGQHDVVTVLFLNVGEVFGEGVGVDDVRRFDPVQDHVHDADDVGEGLLLLAVEGALLQGAVLCGGAFWVLLLEVVESFAEEACRADCSVVDAFAKLRGGDLHDGADKGTRGVILAAITPSVSHILNLGFVEVA